MVLVLAPHFRVFSVDPPDFLPPPYPGKLVPTGVATDTYSRQGIPYGRFLNTLRDEIVYILAKYAEECREYLAAKPHKRASEMADILATGEYARSKLGTTHGKGAVLRKQLAMQDLPVRWEGLLASLRTLTDETLHQQCLELMAQTGFAACREIDDKLLLFDDIRRAQAAKKARIGQLEGLVITHLVLPHGDGYCQRLLETGWYELRPDVRDEFPALRKATLLTRDQLQAVTPR